METSLCSSLEYNTLTFDCKMYNEFGISPSTNDHTSMFGERCPKSLGYTYEKSMDFCYLVHGQWLTWFVAQGICAGVRGQLVKVDTMEKLIYLNSSVTDNTKNYWTGANDQVIEGTFEWRDGTVLADDNEVWGLNQPDDWGGEDCCEIKPALGWKIQDDNCDSTLWFICEYVISY
ncbi:C-type lectin domain family 4 member M-like [Mytilus galloprovincialis]|uniref:C-type lectin domain family 4 member M-like n=1 Tax=Mytilus galloprovincialis TaxID=29158 RepID=UPI003F7B837F